MAFVVVQKTWITKYFSNDYATVSMEGGKILMLSLCFRFCSADSCGRHDQEHTGVWDCAGGGYWPRITGYGLLSGSWTPLHHVWEAGKKLCQSLVFRKLQIMLWTSELHMKF